MSRYPSYVEEIQASRHALANGPVKPKPVNLFHTPFHPDDHKRQSFSAGYPPASGAGYGGATHMAALGPRVMSRRVGAGSAGLSRMSVHGSPVEMGAAGAHTSEFGGDTAGGFTEHHREGPIQIESQPSRDPLLGAAVQMSKSELRRLRVAGRHMRARSHAERAPGEMTIADAMKPSRIPTSVVLDPSLTSSDTHVTSPYAQAGMLPGRALHVIRSAQRRSLSATESPLVIVGMSKLSPSSHSPSNATQMQSAPSEYYSNPQPQHSIHHEQDALDSEVALQENIQAMHSSLPSMQTVHAQPMTMPGEHATGQVRNLNAYY